MIKVATLYKQGRYSDAADVAKEALTVTEEDFWSKTILMLQYP